MKALVFQAPKHARVADIETPAIGAGEVLVRSRAVGICHSDFELLDGHYIIPVGYPAVPGHEWAGEVAEVGAGVRGLAPGDRVVGECVIGEDHFGFSIPGAAAELFRARPEWLHRLPDALSFTQGALVEPFTVAYAAAGAAGGIDASDTVVVLGAGPIGLCCTAAAAAMGARVLTVDPVAGRREVALALGAESALDPAGGDLVEAVGELTSGRLADVCIEASGRPDAMAASLEVTGHRGRVVCVGIDVGTAAPARLGLIQSRALRIEGIIGSPGVWPRALRFLARTGIDLAPVVTGRFPLERAYEALEAARSARDHIKVHIVNEERS